MGVPLGEVANLWCILPHTIITYMVVLGRLVVKLDIMKSLEFLSFCQVELFLILTNQEQTKKNIRLSVYTRFPALGAGCIFCIEF